MPLAPPTDLTRAILRDMEQAFALGDADRINHRFDEQVQFFGSGGTADGIGETAAYIRASVAHIDQMTWDYDTVGTIQESPDMQAVFAVGEMRMRSDGRRAPYRLTFVLCQRGEEWKIVHFHGSTLPE